MCLGIASVVNGSFDGGSGSPPASGVSPSSKGVSSVCCSPASDFQAEWDEVFDTSCPLPWEEEESGGGGRGGSLVYLDQRHAVEAVPLGVGETAFPLPPPCDETQRLCFVAPGGRFPPYYHHHHRASGSGSLDLRASAIYCDGSSSAGNYFYDCRPQMIEGQREPCSPTDQSFGLSQHTMCRVCGDAASGNHFGVLSCEACKSFFRRSIRANARYACRGSRACAIDKHTRNRCQYCRLQKCVSMGMRKEAVQEERTCSGAKLQRADTPTPLGFPSLSFTPPTVPPYTHHFESPTSPVPRMLTQANRMYGSLPNLKMMELERSGGSGMYGQGAMLSPYIHMGGESPGPGPACLGGGGGVGTGVVPSTGVGMAPGGGGGLSVSVLVNADMQSEGQPEQVKPADHSVKLEDLFEGTRTSLMKVIEWAKRIPAFVTLSLDDQVKLLKASWCEQCTLRLAARNGAKSDILLLDHGLTCKREQIEDPEVRRIMGRMFNELAYWLDCLSVDRVELACLKGILLFNPDSKGLSPASRKKVELCQEQILASLETRTKSMYPITPQRFSKLLLRLGPVKSISLEVMQHMEVQRALGNAKMDNLFGELLDFD